MANSPTTHDQSGPLPVAITAAVRWHGLLTAGAWLFVSLGIASALGAIAAFYLKQPALAPTLALLSGGILVIGAALLPACLLASARRRVVEAADAAAVTRRQRAVAEMARAENEQAPQAIFSGSDEPDIVFTAERARLLQLAGWPQSIIAAPLLLVAIGITMWFWPTSSNVMSEDTWGFGIGVACLIISFPILIFERRLSVAATASVVDLPEAGSLSRLIRVALWSLIIVGAGEIARSMGVTVVVYLYWLLASIIVAAAAEAFLRVLVAPFLPSATMEEARGLCDSVVAGLILPRLGAGQSTVSGLKERFGIDLSQSWALGFIRRVSGPLIVVMLIFAWFLTGVTVLSLNERGIYERNGVPTAVLPSGMHVHFPWPFGIVHRIDAGRVYQVTLADTDTVQLPRIDADELDTSAFDRVWNTKHDADAFYVVPGNDEKGADINAAQVLNSDVRVYYRIGLDDAAAIASVYQLNAPENIVRSLSRRELARVFASRTLMAAIGENRASLATAVQAAVQATLDKEQSGLEITAVTIDSIHPPAKAAAAYHGVQESEIISATEVAAARRNSAVVLSEKNREAIVKRRNNEWLAAQKGSDARVEAKRFAAEAQMWKTAGEAMAIERWLQALGKGLPRSQLTIIDHRLQLIDGPVLDLRRFAAPVDK